MNPEVSNSEPPKIPKADVPLRNRGIILKFIHDNCNGPSNAMHIKSIAKECHLCSRQTATYIRDLIAQGYYIYTIMELGQEKNLKRGVYYSETLLPGKALKEKQAYLGTLGKTIEDLQKCLKLMESGKVPLLRATPVDIDHPNFFLFVGHFILTKAFGVEKVKNFTEIKGLLEEYNIKLTEDIFKKSITLLRSRHYPICSNTSGYYYAKDKEDLKSFIDSFIKRRDTFQHVNLTIRHTPYPSTSGQAEYHTQHKKPHTKTNTGTYTQPNLF